MSDGPKILSFTYDDEPVRVDKVIASLPDISSRSQALKLFSQGQIKVNGKVAKASLKCHQGDMIEVTLALPSTVESQIQPYNFPLDIVFEDQDLIIVNKPAGLVVHPSAGHETNTLVNALIYHTSELSMGFDETRPGIVHRIDKDTSGLLVVAKNNFAHENLSLQFKNKTSHRVYFAVVYGPLKFDKKTVTSYLVRHPVQRKRYCSEIISHPDQQPKGKNAISHFEVVENYSNGLSLIKCKLETGRTHQIRVHISELGHPIVGDETYGPNHPHKSFKSSKLKKQIKDCPRFALHAAELGFVHPRTGEKLLFKAPWPKDLEFLAQSPLG